MLVIATTGSMISAFAAAALTATPRSQPHNTDEVLEIQMSAL
jgi:hypothetical protein